jgi:hypothetical protein
MKSLAGPQQQETMAEPLNRPPAAIIAATVASPKTCPRRALQ